MDEKLVSEGEARVRATLRELHDEYTKTAERSPGLRPVVETLRGADRALGIDDVWGAMDSLLRGARVWAITVTLADMKHSRKGKGKQELEYEAEALARTVKGHRERNAQLSDTDIAKRIADQFADKTTFGGRKYSAILTLMRKHGLMNEKKSRKKSSK